MKTDTYIVRVVSPDGTVHSVGSIVLEGGKLIQKESKILDTKEEYAQRIQALSSRCVIEE